MAYLHGKNLVSLYQIRWSSTLGALALLSLLSGCTNSESEAITNLIELDTGAIDVQAKEFIREAQAAVRKSPQDDNAVGQLGMTLEMNGFADRALIAYSIAADLNKANARWAYYESLLLASRGEFESALAAIDESILADPNYAPSWLWRGQWLLELDRTTESRKSYNRAIDLGAADAGSLGLIKVLLREGKDLHALKKLVALNQRIEHPEIARLTRKTTTKLDLVFGDAAEQEDYTPGNFSWNDPWSQSKRSYEASISAALENYRIAIDDPQKADAAHELIERLYARYPNNERVVVTFGVDLHRRDQREQAREIFEGASEKWVDNPVINRSLAEYALEAGDFQTAEGHLNAVLSHDSADGWTYAQLGLIAVETDRIQEARRNFQASLSTEESAEVHFYLANVQANLKEWVHARCHLERAIEMRPDFDEAKNDLARLRQLVPDLLSTPGTGLTGTKCLDELAN